MQIPGYLDGYEPAVADDTLVDRMGLVSGPLFWPAFLALAGGIGSAIEAFDVDPADLSELADQLSDERHWPVFTMPVRDGHRVHIVVCNFPDEASVSYLLSPADGATALNFAELSGNFRGPGLSWPELVAVSRQPDPGLSAAARLLLLLPALGDVATPAVAHELVATALSAVGATGPAAARTTATELLGAQHHWTPATWHTGDDVTWCDGTHSHRTPQSPDLQLFSRAFS